MQFFIDQTMDSYANPPDYRGLGFSGMTRVTSWGLHRKQGGQYVTERIDLATCRRVADPIKYPEFWQHAGEPIVLNEERLQLHSEDLVDRDYNRDQLIDALEIYRSFHPGVSIGYYGRMPDRRYAPNETPESEGYKAWQKRNASFLGGVNGDLSNGRGLATYVDRMYPSLYTLRKDMVDNFVLWKQYVDRNIEEALKYHKPVYPFVNPQNRNKTALPKGVFRHQMEYLLSKPIDGLVLFHNVASGEPWINPYWWDEFLAVIRPYQTA